MYLSRRSVYLENGSTLQFSQREHTAMIFAEDSIDGRGIWALMNID